jgi:tetratricopeptide (TPR) repeat protein
VAVYDAFVSYSHAKDKPIAAALQLVIQTLGKPWYRRRALRIFRDDTSLSATPQLWPSIEQALGNSRFLILLASPEAAASPWVSKEVAYWLEHKSADTLLIALTDGELSWDNTISDFAAIENAPLPPVLSGRFVGEPKWVDLRAYRDGANPRDSRFIEAGADFAAAIRGMPKEDLLSQEVRQQRRALTLAWSAAGSLLVLAGLAGWQAKVALDNERAAIEQRQLAQEQRDRAVEAERLATEQRNEAERQRDRAERTLAAATRTANTLVFNLAREMRDRSGIPIELLRKIVGGTLEMQKQLADSGESTPELRRSEATALHELSDTLIGQGEGAMALAAAARAYQIFEALVAANPASIERQRDLFVAMMKLGRIRFAQGNLSEARMFFGAGFERMLPFVKANPQNKLLSRDLVGAIAGMADVLEAEGKFAEALTVLNNNLRLAEDITKSWPADADWQRELWVAHIRVGDLLVRLNRASEAALYFLDSLVVAKSLADAEPSSALRQFDLAVSNERIGDRMLSVGDPDQALKFYRASLAISERLASSDPANAAWQQHLSMAQEKMGDAFVGQKNFAPALEFHRTSLATRERLAKADPNNGTLQRALGFSYKRVGDTLMIAGRPDEALSEYLKCVAIRERLVAAGPDNVQWNIDLVQGLDALSAVAGSEQASTALLRAITILRPLALAKRLTPEQQEWEKIFQARYDKLPGR